MIAFRPYVRYCWSALRTAIRPVRKCSFCGKPLVLATSSMTGCCNYQRSIRENTILRHAILRGDIKELVRLLVPFVTELESKNADIESMRGVLDAVDKVLEANRVYNASRAHGIHELVQRHQDREAELASRSVKLSTDYALMRSTISDARKVLSWVCAGVPSVPDSTPEQQLDEVRAAAHRVNQRLAVFDK